MSEPGDKATPESIVETADLVHQTLTQAAQLAQRDWDRSPDGKYIRDQAGRALVPGDSVEERRGFMVQLHLKPLVELLRADVPGTFALPRADIFKLLGESLAPETRAVRRNLLVVSASAALIGMTGEAPEKIPGIDFPLGDHRALVVAFVLVLLAWELLAFITYGWGDEQKNRTLISGLRHYAWSLRVGGQAAEGYGERLAAMCPDKKFGELASYVLSDFSRTAARSARELDQKRRPGVLRRWLEFWAPLVVAMIAALTMVASAFHLWNVRWFALAAAGIGLAVVAFKLVREWLRRRAAFKRVRQPPPE